MESKSVGKTMIGKICREYRLEKGIKIIDFAEKNETLAKSIVAFEHGRSTNIRHLERYIDLAIENEDTGKFFNKLIQNRT